MRKLDDKNARIQRNGKVAHGSLSQRLLRSEEMPAEVRQRFRALDGAGISGDSVRWDDVPVNMQEVDEWERGKKIDVTNGGTKTLFSSGKFRMFSK